MIAEQPFTGFALFFGTLMYAVQTIGVVSFLTLAFDPESRHEIYYVVIKLGRRYLCRVSSTFRCSMIFRLFILTATESGKIPSY